jgi:phosphoserine phosphatase
MTGPVGPAPDRRLVVFDVDGVIFQGQFMLSLARGVGLAARLASLRDCLSYEWGLISLEDLLRRVYGRAAGRPCDVLRQAYDRLALSRNAAETVLALCNQGHEVWLASAGVPQEMVDDLVLRLGAHGGIGLEVECADGRLTGRVAGEVASTDGKAAAVERLLAERGLDWSRVVAVGDDRNNLRLLECAGVSVGFQATLAARRRARFLVDGADLAQVLRFVHRPPGAAAPARRPLATEKSPLRFWRREVGRKAIHALAALTPALHRRFPMTVSLGLGAAAGLYLIAEFLRLNGVRLPVYGRLMLRVIRRNERRRLALAPLTLAAGVLASLALFAAPVAYAAALVVAISDSVATLIGRRWARIPLPHNPYKSVEGSLAALAAAFVCAWACLPAPQALTAALAAALVESLDIGDWDNLLVPLAAGVAATLAAAS